MARFYAPVRQIITLNRLGAAQCEARPRHIRAPLRTSCLFVGEQVGTGQGLEGEAAHRRNRPGRLGSRPLASGLIALLERLNPLVAAGGGA